MPVQAIDLLAEDAIGNVTAVDTTRVFIRVDDHEKLKKVVVGNLLAIQGMTGHQFLIGLVERITRLPGEAVIDDLSDDDTLPAPDPLQDTIRATLIGTYRTKDGDHGPSFKRGADSCPQIDQNCYVLNGANLQSFMGVLSQDVAEDQALRLGTFVIDPTAKAIADGNRLFQRHAAILGSTGSGKSWAVALILERAKALKHSNIIVFDLHGEYSPLSEGASACSRSYKIAGPGDLVNPAENVVFLPYWVLNREEMLSILLDRNDQNAPNQASRFTTHVKSRKQATLDGLDKADVAASFTVDSPIPYALSDLVEDLRTDDTEMVEGQRGPKQGEWHGKLTRFIGRLEAKVDDRRYGFMFSPPVGACEYGWLAEFGLDMLCSPEGEPGVKVIDFSEVPSDVLPVVVSVFARLLYDIQFWIDPLHRTPFCFVCDEAHLYLPARDDADASMRRALQTFERIAKEGRKYGVSLLVVSQRPSDVSRTILSQCNNLFALRLTNEQDQAAVRSVMPDSMAGIADVLPLLDVGEALVLGDAVLLPSRVRLDKPTVRPKSATRDFWSEWATQEPNSEAISAAVEALRKQSRN